MVMKDFSAVFSPNRMVSNVTVRIMIFVQVVVAVLFWSFWNFPLAPKPWEIFGALKNLWFVEGLGHELMVSFMVNIHALTLTTVISLGLAYLTVLPVIRPVVGFVSKLRFLGLAGLTLFFTLVVGGGYELKVALLVFGTTVFFVTSMVDVVVSIPKEKFDHARTLKMGEWRTVFEVIVLGKLDVAIEILRQNAAIGWMMLSMVEGIVRSEGGIGALLLTQNKHFHLAEVFAIQFVILAVGILQDYLIGFLKKTICPYANLNLERR
jgi:NitT/TauT family transport system permease protein